MNKFLVLNQNHGLTPWEKFDSQSGVYLFQIRLREVEGRLLETEGFLEGGGLFNLAKMVVLALHKELERKVEKLKYKKLKVMRPRIKSKSNLLTRKYTIQDQSK